MPVPSSIDDLSTTASSNSPAGGESPTDGDNYIRTHASFIALLRDKLDGTSDTGIVKNATFSGTMAGAASWSGLQSFLAGIETTAPNGKVYGTTYSPSYTQVTNVASILSSYDVRYTRIGNVVSVAGQVVVTPISASLTEIGISLPIASSFTANHQASGTCAFVTGSIAGDVIADATNDRAHLRFNASGSSAHAISFHFSYTVL